MVAAESRFPALPAVLAVLALVALAVAVPVSFPGRLGYGCGGPTGADLDQNARGQWLVLRGTELAPTDDPVVVRYSADWRELARYELSIPADATPINESERSVRAVSIVPSEPEDDGFWVLTRSDRAYKFARNGTFTGDVNPRRVVAASDDPSTSVAPASAIDWETEQYGDAVDAERGERANFVLATDGTVLEYTTNWQYTGVTHEGVAGSTCFGERPAWPSAWELLVASAALGLLGLAIASWLVPDDLAAAAALALAGPVVAGTFSMYLLPDVATAVYRLPDVALGVGLLVPVAWAAWTTDEDPVASAPVLALSGAALVAAGVRFLLASALV